MNFIKKIGFLVLGLAILGSMTIGKSVHAVSYYGLSCTNLAYGTQNSDGYTYIQSYVSSGAAIGNDEVFGDSGGIAHYLGRDCLYAGAGLTNSAAIVSGDVARHAANAIIGSINQRISYAMSQNAESAAHMSYTSNSRGIGMAANRIFNGLSLWTNYSDSDFENDQTFSNFREDSNNYDGDASSLSFGLDKMIGNILIGVVASSYDTDITTSVNSGSYKADGDTLGIYAGFNTGVLMLSAGFGAGDFEIDTDRLDMGTGNTRITASGVEADVEYFHLSAMAAISRGRITMIPRLSYRSFDIDNPAFTDVVANDSNTAGPSSDNTTGTNSAGKNTQDISVASLSASSEQTELGINASIKVKSVSPFIDLSYVNEDTTSAQYQTELTTDGVTDQAASDPDTYTVLGGGLNFNVRGRLNGTIAYYELMDRDDYSESTLSATLKLNF